MKRKVLFISPNCSKYGAERSLVTLAAFLNKSGGYESHVLIPEYGDIVELLNAEKVQFTVQKFYCWTNIGKGRRVIKGLFKLLLNYCVSLKVKRRLESLNFYPDIVHTNVITTSFGHQLATKLKCKSIWHIREFGKLDFNMDFDLGTYLSCSLVDRSDLVIANSKAVLDYYGKALHKARKIFIHNGINWVPEIQRQFNGKIFKIIMVGRLGEEKGHRDIINSIAFLVELGVDNIHLDIYGEGSEYSSLREMVSENKLDPYITFEGFSDSIDYSQYHLGIICSRNEAFGRVTVEYMMSGLPVIGTNSGGTKEIVKDGVGFLYAVGDFEQLARHILIFRNDRSLCRVFGGEARRLAMGSFTTEEYCSQIVSSYEQILSPQIKQNS